MTPAKKYFENLDGLRFMAFFSVFISHCFAFSGYKVQSHLGTRIVGHFFLQGDLGVNFFFVLSGFLITFLLLKEKANTSTVSVRKFFVRRLLRIWPVYFLTVCLGFFALPALLQNVNPNFLPFDLTIPLSELPIYCLFVVNFDIISNGINYITVVVLWSVSIEEQFYLVWPLLCRLTSKYLLLITLCLLIILSYAYRFVNYSDVLRMRYSTFSVVNDLAIGGLCAWLVFYSEHFKMKISHLKKPYIIGVYLAFAICLPLRGFIHFYGDAMDRLLVSFEPFLFSLFFAFTILEQNYALHSFYKMHKIRLFNRLGIISYGLYCYHLVFILLTAIVFKVFFGNAQATNFFLFIVQSILALMFAIFASSLSYRFYESRFLGLKTKFEVSAT